MSIRITRGFRAGLGCLAVLALFASCAPAGTDGAGDGDGDVEGDGDGDGDGDDSGDGDGDQDRALSGTVDVRVTDLSRAADLCVLHGDLPGPLPLEGLFFYAGANSEYALALDLAVANPATAPDGDYPYVSVLVTGTATDHEVPTTNTLRFTGTNLTTWSARAGCTGVEGGAENILRHIGGSSASGGGTLDVWDLAITNWRGDPFVQEASCSPSAPLNGEPCEQAGGAVDATFTVWTRNASGAIDAEVTFSGTLPAAWWRGL